jgi:ankyrin repeat protein
MTTLWEELHEAVLGGDTAKVRQLLPTCHVNRTDQWGHTVLFAAVCRPSSNDKVVQRLLKNTREESTKKRSRSNHRQEVHVRLLVNGYLYCEDDEEETGTPTKEETFLHLTARMPPDEADRMVRLLLEAGADASRQDNNGYTALHYCVLSANWTVLPLLLDAVDNHCSTTDTTLSVAEYVNLQDEETGSTALHHSVGKADALLLLLGAGADPDVPNHDGSTALHHACRLNRLGAVHWLLAAGADVTICDKETGSTPLHIASFWGFTEAVVALLVAGADPNVQRRVDRSTAMHCAVHSTKLKVLRALVEAGANGMIQDQNGATALHAASNQVDCEAMMVLLLAIDGGVGSAACCNVPDHDGQTAVHVATRSGNVEGLSLLLRRGADGNVQDKDGLTALHCACKFGNYAAVSALLEAGVDANICSKEGHSALQFATLAHRFDLVRQLVNHGAEATTLMLKDTRSYNLVLRAIEKS